MVQHESKALIDCGRSAEMLDLVRIIEPLGDLLRRVQMHQNDDQEPKDSSYDSYIPSSPEFTDDTTAISTGSRDKENEENTEADLDIAMANRLPPEEEGVSANDTHDSDHETAISCFGDLANTGEASTPKRARCGIPSVMSEPVLSLMGKAPTSSCSLSSLNSVKCGIPSVMSEPVLSLMGKAPTSSCSLSSLNSVNSVTQTSEGDPCCFEESEAAKASFRLSDVIL
ncbi:unnamed protein product [Toxocara canis]|uniref:Uncharacterized protein n=1 Tax=Toxocara canis TaxID=6265 RepID=A0A3P7ISI5_TOXCA|nr:unnamed protein product [Toxocara canis]